jgi:hypothetical protein
MIREIARKLSISVLGLVMAASVVPVAYAQTVPVDGTAVATTPVTAVAVTTNTAGANLGNLFLLGDLFAGDPALTGVPCLGPSLGDIFVLNQLFGGNPFIGGGISANDLGQAFIVDNLFNGNSNGLLNPFGTTLGDVALINGLFQ